MIWSIAWTFIKGLPREVWYALAALLLAWLAYSWVYHRGVKAEHAKTVAVQVRLDAALLANASNLAVIAQLEDANQELANGRQADRDAADKAVSLLVTNRNKLAAALAAAQRNRSKVYARDPKAAEIGATVIPDALADGLR